MNLPRRAFLRQTALGVGGLAVGARLAAAMSGSQLGPYDLVPLGRTSLRVSRVCLGTGMRGGNRESNHTRMGKARFEALIRGSFERGVRLFDLADLYGTHPYVTPALQGIARDRYCLVSKVWFRQGSLPETERPDADVVVDRFLKELQTDYLDLVLLHCVTSATWPAALRAQMDRLSALRQRGRIRALGVSCHSIEALEAAAAEPWVESVHARINPYGMSMDGPPEQVLPVLQRIHDAGKGVVGMKIIGEGRLRDDHERRDASVRFALRSGCVDVLNVGCESLAELDDLADRVRRA